MSGCSEDALRAADAGHAAADAGAPEEPRHVEETPNAPTTQDAASGSSTTPTDGPVAGGTRLRAVLAEASDGTARLLHWWDTELDVACAFEPLQGADGWRCLPTTAQPIYEGVDELFGDADCSEPLWRGGGLPFDAHPVVQRLDTHCWLARDYFRVGARFAEDVAYQRTEQGCMAVAPQVVGPQSLYPLAPLPLEAFVAATVSATAGDGPVVPQHLVAEDGSRAPHGFRDLAGGFACSPRETVLGMRCLPMSFGWGDRGGLFADAGCSTPAALGQAQCGGRLGALPYVLFADPGGAVAEVRLGGTRLERAYEQFDGEGCAATTSKIVGFAIGEPVALETFLPAKLSYAAGASGLVQTMTEVADPEGASVASVADLGSLTTDALGGYECTLATDPDGAVRCVPGINLFGPDYEDPACTQQVWQFGDDLMAVARNSNEPEAPASMGVGLPRVERVLVEASTYEGPVYARHGADCMRVPDVPNTRQPYRRFAREAPLNELPELSIVAR